MIPLLFEPTPEQLKVMEEKNRCAVKMSKRNHELLTVINDVIGQRLKGVTEACQRKRA